jgi:hypothetical protein
MRIGFGMRQALKRKNVPLGMLRAIEDQLNASFSQVGDRHLSFFTFKSRDEYSASLKIAQRLSYRHWPGHNGVCRGFTNF